MRGLSFHVAGIPVTVDPTFLLIAVFLGFNRLSEPALLVGWIGVVFVSILVHELGHAFAFRAFGQRPEVTLYAMGGLTSAAGRQSPGRSLVTSLAGPAAGFTLGALTYVLADNGLLPVTSPVALQIVNDLIFVGIVWTILNLAPILPLDGGHSLQAVLDLVTRGRGRRPTLIISIVIAVGAGAYALSRGELWIALLCGLFTAQNVSSLTSERKAVDAEAQVDALRRVAAGDDPDETVRVARNVRDGTAALPVRTMAADLVVAGHLAAGRSDEAGAALQDYPDGIQPSVRARAHVAFAQGRADEGLELLRQTHALHPSAGSARDLAEGLARAGRGDEALATVADAIAGGHLDRKTAERDPQLGIVRGLAGWDALRARLA